MITIENNSVRSRGESGDVVLQTRDCFIDTLGRLRTESTGSSPPTQFRRDNSGDTGWVRFSNSELDFLFAFFDRTRFRIDRSHLPFRQLLASSRPTANHRSHRRRGVSKCDHHPSTSASKSMNPDVFRVNIFLGLFKEPRHFRIQPQIGVDHRLDVLQREQTTNFF
jgi:hypothetical protein